MNFRIVSHIFPHEIDFLDRICDSLLRNANYVDTSNVTVDVTLNVSEALYDYSEFKIPLSFFQNKFRFLERKISEKYKVDFDINSSIEMVGLNPKRRQVIENTNDDVIIYLDTDVYFNDTTLYYMKSACERVYGSNLDYFIITPQIYKYWDTSWDIITNKEYLNNPFNFRDLFNSYSAYTNNSNPVNIMINTNRTKLGGGWFNAISSKLLKKIGIPESFGPYGEDDTYLMHCCDILRHKGWDVRQYVLENVIVFEDAKFRYSPYSEFLPKLKDIQAFRQTAIDNMRNELINFEKKINNGEL